MTQPVSRPSAPEAAPGPEEPTTEFVAHDPGPQPAPHSSIDQEIARSERASAALAATRALARAAFTDSQLAADDAAAAAGEDAAQDAIDTEWVRTEYVALEHTLPPDDAARRDGPPRHPAGGSFNPGIASQQGRSFPGASMADASPRTRTGAQAQFHHEARHAPRAEAPAAATGHPARPVVTPAHAAAPSRTQAAPRTPRRDGLRFLLAAGLGGLVVLAGGGLAWRAGWVSHAAAPVTAAAPAAAATPTPAAVAAQAEAARILSPAAPQEIAVTPAAGAAPPRTSADVEAALAVAARAAAVPTATVPAAGPEPVARPQRVAVPAVAASAATPAARGKADVAAAIAHAQAKADRFLSSGGGDAAAPAATEGKQAP